MKKDLDYEATIKRVGFITIIWNIVLAVIKLFVGIIGGSSSMVSDAVHTASDVFTTIIVMIGAKFSHKKNDEDHPYGHERFESLASILLALLLAVTALGIGYSGTKNIIAFFKHEEIVVSEFVYLALFGAILSIVGKGIMYFYTIKAAKRINSSSLKADAYHHLSDSLSSIGSLLGIIGLMIGKFFVILDPIASLIICVLILKVAFDTGKEGVNQLVDKSAPASINESIKNCILSFVEVKRIDEFKTRQFGNKIYVDICISLDKTLTLIEADKIADTIHDTVEHEFTDVKHCMIHSNPYIE